MRWPAGIADPGRQADALVSLVDFTPTFLELAGVEGNWENLHGQSLVPYLAGERPAAWRGSLATQFNGVELYYSQRSVITKDWKFAAAIETTSFVTQQEQGAYAVSDYSFGLGPGSPLPGNPIEDYYTIFETYNYPATYDGIGSCHCSPGIGIGPTVRVPGLGTVNISAALNEELTRAPAVTWSQYAYDWARYVNQQLPFIQIQNNTYHKAYSSRRYTDWPPASDRRLWDNFGPALVFIQEAGYLKARRA